MSALRTITIALAFALLTSAALAQTSVMVAWDPNPAEEQVTGYYLYYGVTSAADPAFVDYDAEVDVGNVTEYTVELPDASTVYYLAVVARNGAGLRSDYSAEVATQAIPGANTHTVAVSAGAGGSVSPSGNVSVNHGDNLTVAITPNAGYEVANVMVDGSSVGAVVTHTLSNIITDRTVAATFQVTESTDSDDDQLPDAWELQYFSGLDTDPAADADADGRTNYQEYLAGTDPTVAQLEPALAPTVAFPISGATVVSLAPELAVDSPVNDAGIDLSYQFEVSTEPDMSVPVAAARDVTQDPSGVTGWTLTVSLDDQTRYYWRARTIGDVAASDWTPVNTFFLDTAGAATTTELVMAEYIPATANVSAEILDPTSGVDGLGVDVAAATLPYDFILTVSTVTNPPPIPRAARLATRLAGQTVEFGPHGRPFSRDVTIMLPYDDQTLAEAGLGSAADLAVLTYNTTTLRWEAVPDVVTDYAGSRMIARVDHFSMYSLGAASAQTPVAVPTSSTGGGGGGGGGCFIGSLW